MSRKEDRRYDHKRDRQAARASLRGDHVKQPLTSNWGHKPEPSLITDESQQISPRGNTRGNGRKCKRSKDGQHKIISNPKKRYVEFVSGRRWLSSAPFACEYCSKQFWTIPRSLRRQVPYTPMPEHWSTANICLRLAGHNCLCPDPKCVDKRTEN